MKAAARAGLVALVLLAAAWFGGPELVWSASWTAYQVLAALWIGAAAAAVVALVLLILALGRRRA